jgi:5-methylcytosine-specific restriction endonuclease McrA
MTPVPPKTRRIKLEPDAYDRLRLEILERDHWRCQHCGSRHNLQVHHQELRSHSGSDAEQNMMTLCAVCHRRIHRDYPVRNLG